MRKLFRKASLFLEQIISRLCSLWARIFGSFQYILLLLNFQIIEAAQILSQFPPAHLAPMKGKYQYQFRHSVMSDSLQPHELKLTRPPCPSPTPRVYPNSCPLSRWCHLTISSSVVCFSSCLQSFPTSGSFQMSQLFASGGQNIGVSVSTTVLPMNSQDWFPLGWTKGKESILLLFHQDFCCLHLQSLSI